HDHARARRLGAEPFGRELRVDVAGSAAAHVYVVPIAGRARRGRRARRRGARRLDAARRRLLDVVLLLAEPRGARDAGCSVGVAIAVLFAALLFDSDFLGAGAGVSVAGVMPVGAG